jgi:hypothetical protein
MIQYECDATSFFTSIYEEKDKVIFSFAEKSLIINFCDSEEKVLEQSEICKSDAIRIAKLILYCYEV